MSFFQCDAKQKYNPVQQMNPMQEVLLTIQTRCANAANGMYKVGLSTCNASTADIAELCKLEIYLQSQIQILEQGKNALPGSSQDEFAMILCRSQSRLKRPDFVFHWIHLFNRIIFLLSIALEE